jgi:hypothetical protein
MQPHATAPVLALGVALVTLGGCAYDPHPASGSTPGDPEHPGSASIYDDQPAPMTPPGSSGTRPVPAVPGAVRGGPPTTLNGYGDPTAVEQGVPQ